MDSSVLFLTAIEGLLAKIAYEMRSPKPEVFPERLEAWMKELSELRSALAQSNLDPYVFVSQLEMSLVAAANDAAVINRQEAPVSYDEIRRWVTVGFLAVSRAKSESADRGSGDRVAEDRPAYEHESAPMAMRVEEEVCPPHPVRSAKPWGYLSTRLYRVWFGTDRKFVSGVLTKPRVLNEWSSKLTVGSCVVHVPKTHKFGSLGSSWITRQVRKVMFQEEDDRLELRSVRRHTAATFSRRVGEELSKWSKRTALVFVHGYNVSFEEAAIRAAQIGFDLRVDGITAFFSWPSQGELVPYVQDEANVELSENHFIEFLVKLSQSAGLEEINVLAHSMGNRLLCRTVPRLVELRKTGELAVPIGQIVLAAADLTTEFFHQYAALYPKLASRRVTNYSYKADRALLASRALHGIGRIGLEPPIYVHPGIDTISASKLKLDLLGHGYFAEAEPLLYDIGDLIHNNAPPAGRRRVEPGPTHLGAHWVLAR